MSEEWVTVWARAQRGVAAVASVNRRHFEAELAHTYGARELRLVFGARYDEGDACVAAAISTSVAARDVLFSGESSGTVQAGGVLISDPVFLGDMVESPVRITWELISGAGSVSAFDSAAYDAVQLAPGSAASASRTIFGLSAVELRGSRLKGCVAFFGDSICELGTYFKRCRPVLEQRGYAALNLGISGNRLLRDIEWVDFSKTSRGDLQAMREKHPDTMVSVPRRSQAYGLAGVKRFSADVLACSGLRMVIIALGVNDLYIPGTFCGSMDELPSAEDLMGGYAQLASLLDDRAEAAWCSLTPFVSTYGEEGRREHLRTEVNDLLEAWAADRGERFVSFEDVLAPKGGQDTRLFEPDLLHPNDLGGAAMFARMRPMLDV